MKKGIKKLIALSTVAVMALSLAACGGESSESSSTSGSSTTSESSESSTTSESSASSESSAGSETAGGGFKMAWVHQHITNSFQISASEGADDKAAELGIELTHLDAEQNAEQQISQIEQCIAEGYDVIAFEPVNPDGLIDAAQEVMDAGIICLNMASAITGWEDVINGFAGASNVEIGEIEMQNVMDLIGGEGQIAILTGPEGDSGAMQRYEGYQNVLADYPDVEVVVESACDWDTALAQSTVESWKVAYPDLKAIVSENDGMAVGAGNVYGPDSDIIITGVDASEDGLEAIADGRQTGTVSQDAYTMGQLLVELANDFMTGEAEGLGVESLVEAAWIDASNVADYTA
jgi:inositol transport system substrate-binding protein